MDEIWLNMANAIILQAVHDYRKAKAVLKRYPNNAEALAMIADVERFFKSNWFCRLTSADWKKIFDRLEEEEV